MRFRKLRIAWSVVCGIACVLLIALWVRSYWTYDIVGIAGPGSEYSIHSTGGFIGVYDMLDISGTSGPTNWRYVHRPSDPANFRVSAWRPHYSTYPDAPSVSVEIPYWMLVLPLGLLAAIPWLRWHFSIRTLLIATTLVAVVLGLIVWLIR